MVEFYKNATATWLRKFQIFRKSGLSKRFVAFRRPCRGLSTWKGASPKELWFYMTRRAVLALRVIPVQGKFDQTWWIKRIQLEVSSGEVFRRFLAIHKFVLHFASHRNYFTSRPVRSFIREVQDNVLSVPIFEKYNMNLDTKIDDFSEKGSLQEICWFWAALPGAQNPDGSSPQEKVMHMASRDGDSFFCRTAILL